MTRLSADALSAYGDSLVSISKEASSAFSSTCDEILQEYGGDLLNLTKEEKAELKKRVLDLSITMQDTYGSASSALGEGFFQAVLEAQGETIYTEESFEADVSRTKQSIGYHAKHLYGEAANWAAFVAGCASFVERITYHAADATVANSAVAAGKKKKGLKFARVPSGPTCAFCIMLASRGFVYASKETAGEYSEYHNKCDCRIVAGFDGLKIEGYDHEGMYDRYKTCRDTIEHGDPVNGPVWQSWSKMPAAEKAKYENFNDYTSKMVLAEMRTRDRQWLYSGKASRTWDRERGAKPDDKEKRAANSLVSAGIAVDFRRPIDKTGQRTSDCFIGDQRWEMKNPEGTSEKAVKNQLKSAVGTRRKEQQCDRVIISNVASELSFDDLCKQTEDLIKDGRFIEIIEILILDKNGRLRRYKRN